MAKTSKNTPLFLALVAFWSLSFQARSLPMFSGEEQAPTFSFSGKPPAEIVEQQGRRTTDPVNGDTHSNGSSSSQAARGTACDATDFSMKDDESNGVSTSQFADAVANCGIDPLAREVCLSEKFEKILSLENFRAAAANPALAESQRLIIDSDSGLIRPHNEGSDSRTKRKNETIILALKEALQIEFPRFSPAVIERIVEEELPHSSTWSMFEKLQGKPALSTETLQRILEKADSMMAERNFSEEYSFTLQDFRNALANPENHGAERLIISGQGASAMIVAQAGIDHAADAIIRKTLKRALEREGHRRDFVHQLTSEELPCLGILKKMWNVRPTLSFEKLKTIIQQADDAMAESKLLQATRSVVHLSAPAMNRAAARELLRSGIEQFFARLGIQNETLPAHISAAAISKSAEEIAAEQAAAAQQAALEKSEVEKILRSLIYRGRSFDEMKEHYREAEEAAIAAEAAHHQAMEARWHAENKARYLKEARSFFEKVKTALAEKRELAEFDESTLSKLSQGADLTGAVLGILNVPFLNVQGIADAVSTFATFADHRMTIAEAQRAYKRLQAAIQKAEAANEGHEQVEETANKLQAHADETERLKKQEAHDEILRLSNFVRLPDDAGDEALRQWATELTCESDPANENDATIIAHLLYKQAKKNLSQMHELITRLWGERVALLQEALQRLTEKPPFDPEYETAQKKEVELEATASAARDTLEGAAQVQSEWLIKRDQLRIEKQILEDQLRKDAEHRAERQAELEAKRRELADHQTRQESINRIYQAAAAEAKRLTTLAAKAHVDGFEKHKIFTAADQLYTRSTARLRAVVEVEQKVLDEILMAKIQRGKIQTLQIKVHEIKAQLTEAIAQAKTALAGRAARLRAKEAEALEEAVNNYNWAVQEQAKGNSEASDAWHKCAQAYEARALNLAQGKEEVAKAHRRKAEILEKVADGYSRAAREQAKVNSQAAETWRKCAQAYEAQVAALERDDKIQDLHKKRAESLSCAAKAYIKAAEEKIKDHKESSEAYNKEAQAYEAQVAALEQNDTEAQSLHARRATVFHDAAEAYSKASEEQTKDNQKAAGAWRKCAQAYEAQVAALERDDKIQYLHQERARSLSYAAKAYSKAAEEKIKGYKEASEAYCKEAQTREDELERDKKGNLSYFIPAEVFREAAEAHSKASEEQIKGHKEASEAYRKSAQAGEDQAAALARGDRTIADLHQKRARALSDAAKAYGSSNEEYRKQALAYEAQAMALGQQVEALAQSDTETAKRYKERADAFDHVVMAYSLAVRQEMSKSRIHIQARKVSPEACRKAAQLYEEQAAALGRGDTETAKLYKELADALMGMGNTLYNSSPHQGPWGGRVCPKGYLRDYEARALALLQQVETLAEKDQIEIVALARQIRALNRETTLLCQDVKVGAKRYKEIGDLWQKVAIDSARAKAELANGDTEAANAARQRVQTFESEVAVLTQQIEAIEGAIEEAIAIKSLSFGEMLEKYNELEIGMSGKKATGAKSESTTSSPQQKKSLGDSSTSEKTKKEKGNCTIS